jgi:hypothetical protein
MTRQSKIAWIGGLIILSQIFIFRDNLFPFQWGQIKVSGLACTCPDETVINGKLYLRSITPDSLKKYNIDYSEIYVTQKPSTKVDPMGTDQYMIKGKVVGIQRVSDQDPWNLKIEVDQWREIDLITDWGVKGIFFLELLILGMILTYSGKKRHIT